MWRAFENGTTIGLRGSENGETIRDEEHPIGARITLERNAGSAPFAITCGVYGWMVHTRFFSNENEANLEYEKMKASIEEIVSSFNDPANDDRLATGQAIERFVAEYP